MIDGINGASSKTRTTDADAASPKSPKIKAVL
jgi:hypothetical protein